MTQPNPVKTVDPVIQFHLWGRPLLGLVLYVPFSVLSGDRKDIRPLVNHVPLIPRGSLLEHVEQEHPRGTS